MGYTTEFKGKISITPPLSALEVKYLDAFCNTRRMKCEQGPYYINRGGMNNNNLNTKKVNQSRLLIGHLKEILLSNSTRSVIRKQQHTLYGVQIAV